MYDTIIVEDNDKALKDLARLINKHCPTINITGEAKTIEEAFELITQQAPQLLFLDVELPRGTGFDLLDRLPSLDFEIIFATGHDKYAVDAIKFCAIGYLQKPVAATDLVKAVARAKKRMNYKIDFEQNKQLLKNLANPNSLDNRIGIPLINGIDFITVKDIIRCEAMKGATKVIIQNKKSIVSSYNLGEFKKLLEPYKFYSPHKSHLINYKVHMLRYDSSGYAEMSDKFFVPVSRYRKKAFLQLLTYL